MKIVIVAIQTSKYWKCIDQDFNDCPSGTFRYSQEIELVSIRKSDWKKIGQCENTVIVINTSTGISKNTYPLKIDSNSNNRV